MPGILKKGLKRTETEYFVQNFIADLLLFERTEQGRLGIDKLNHRLAHFGANTLVVDGRQGFQVDLVHQLAMQRELELLIFRL